MKWTVAIVLGLGLIIQQSHSQTTNENDRLKSAVSGNNEDVIFELRERVSELERLQKDADRRLENTESSISQLVKDVDGRLKLSGFVVGSYTYDQRSSTSLRPLLRDNQFRGGDASLYFRTTLPNNFNSSVQLIFNPRPQDNIFPKDEDVEIERAFVQWSPDTTFQIKIGRFLTPVGYWNYILHDEPLLPTFSVPLIIRRKIFPEEINGLALEGEIEKKLRFGYAAWVGNGITEKSKFDDNNNKAFGGRLYVVRERESSLIQIGVSAYSGDVEKAAGFAPADSDIRKVAALEGRDPAFFEQRFESNGLTPWGQPIKGSRDRSVGFDIQLDYSRLRLRSEIAHNWIKPDKTENFPNMTEFREWGLYLYLGYQFDLSKDDSVHLSSIEPFIRYDFYDGNTETSRELQSLELYSAGFSYGINEYLQFRTEVNLSKYRVTKRDFIGVTMGLVASF